MNLYKKDTKMHYKMYKSGKNWLISGITTAVMVISISDFVSHNQASANDQVGVQENQNNVNSSTNTAISVSSNAQSSIVDSSKSITSTSSNVQSSSVDSSKATTSTSSNAQSSSVDGSNATTSTSSNTQSSSVDSNKATTSISSNAQSSSVDSSKATTSNSSNSDSSSDSSKTATSAQSDDSSSASDSESGTSEISNRMLDSSNDTIKALPSGGSYVTTDGGKTYKYVYQNSPLKGLYNDNGKLVYFDGYDGTQARGVVYNIDNSNYVFDKNSGDGTKINEISGGQYRQATANDGQNSIPSAWVYQQTNTLFAKGIQSIDGNLRYFDTETGSQLKGGTAEIAGADYYFEPSQGDLIGNVDQIVNNGKYINNNGNNQYVDIDNTPIKGLTSINNSLQYFDSNGNQVKNQQVITNDATYYFDDSGNGQYLFTNTGNSASTDTSQHNVANSTNQNDYKNTVDGFLTADSWYRPKDILDGGTTWRASNSSDYRPVITNWWPNKDIQVNYLKLMQDNGLLSNDVQYNRFSDQTALDQAAQTAQIGIEQKIKQANSTDWLNNLLFQGSTSNPSFVNKQYIWNMDSESYGQGADQWFQGGYLKYGNSVLTPTTNSNYRQTENGFDFLLANDVDNSNPVVQAEDLNWLYYMMNFGTITAKNNNANFDGIRVDAVDFISDQALQRTYDYLRDAYGLANNEANANQHLSLVEGGMDAGTTSYKSDGLIESNFRNMATDALNQAPGKNSTLAELLKDVDSGVVIADHSNESTDGAVPNYSIIHAHDKGIQDHIGDILSGQLHTSWTDFTQDELKQALQIYYDDQASTDKKYNAFNVPSTYAVMLTNKNTVPRVYYGDLYDDNGQYMQNQSIYYNSITALMEARKQYVGGGQSMNVDNNGVLTSVRYGNGAMTASDTGDADTRTQGIGVVVSNNTNLNLADNDTVTLNMGAAHANQQYRALLLTTSNGLQTYNSDADAPVAYTDANGNLTFSNKNINNQDNTAIKGFANPQVTGYLSAWVPVGALETQDARTTPSTSQNTDDKVFHQNAALDSNLIYEGFSNFQPEPTNDSERTNVVIANNAQLFRDWGITSFEIAPQYKSTNDHTFLDSTINNGYAFNDRYNLGFDGPTKYGDDNDLRNAIQALHESGMQVMADIVYNQLYGLPGQEVVSASRSNVYGGDNHQPFGTQLYVTDTIGGGKYQEQYGGEFLNEIKDKYPYLFKGKNYNYYWKNYANNGAGPTYLTTLNSTSLDIPSDQPLKQWSAKYMNGTNLLGRGMGYVLKDWNTGNYFMIDGNNTTLPSTLSSDSIYLHGWNENSDSSWSYYDEKSSKPLVGSQTINNQNVYFDENGKQVKGQIVSDSNNQKRYYEPSLGTLVTNQDIVIDSVKYHADSNGVLSLVDANSGSSNTNNSSNNGNSSNPSTSSNNSIPTVTPSTNTGIAITPTVSIGGGYVAPTTTTSSSSSSATSSASSSATSSSSSTLSSASSSASSTNSSASSSSATSASSSVNSGSNEISTGDKAKDAMIKAQSAVKVAEKLKNQTHSKAHVKNYNKALDNYYQAEKQYLKVAKLHNGKYYYDFDKVTKNSKYVKLSKAAYVYDSKKFNEDNRVSKVKKGTKVKVNEIVRHGKTTRFNIGHNKFITGLKSFIHKLIK